MGNKNKMDEDFYKNDIEVLQWLKDNSSQRIRFSNRYEYKVNNNFHREDGPAIEFFDGVGNQYYFEGKKLTSEEWINFKRLNLIDKIIDDK